jgi:hypothetical protein
MTKIKNALAENEDNSVKDNYYFLVQNILFIHYHSQEQIVNKSHHKLPVKIF